MLDKAGNHRPKGDDPPNGAPTPITPIANSGLAEAIKHGGRIYQLMVDAVKDYAIFMLDPAGYIASWNQGAQRIKGYNADEIIGRHFSVFYTEDAIEIGHPQHELEIATRDGRFEEEGWRVRKDGSMFWANVVITAVRDETGELIGFAKVTRDLTERRNAEQRALADARRLAEAESANAAKAEFLTAMSHELRTPLNAIGGYTELLSLGLGGPITSEQVDYLERIRHSQQHLMGIISDLLNFSRIEGGHLTYDIAPVSLGQVIDSVVPLVEPQATAKGINITVHTGDEQCVVQADRAKTEQVLLNLLSNAVKFTNAGGTYGCQQGWDRLDVHSHAAAANDAPGRRESPPLSRNDFADVKVAELGVLRAHFVEAHVGNQFLEVDRILREKRDAPFPRSQSDRTGNHLLDFSGIAASRQPVSLH